MYPPKPHRTMPPLETRISRLIFAALIAGTGSLVSVDSVRAGEVESNAAKLRLNLPDSTQQILSSNPHLLTQAASEDAGRKVAKKPTLNLDKNGVILKGYDPVAYFKKGQAIKGDPRYSTTYQGAIYHFASAADKRTFEKNPAKYKPQYGGFCAHGMSEGKLSDIDPNEFFIYRGKLYVCTGPEQIKGLKAKPDDTIKKADKNWQRYQPPEIPGYLGQNGMKSARTIA